MTGSLVVTLAKSSPQNWPDGSVLMFIGPLLDCFTYL
jgi:hypothetical protein